MCTRQMVLVPIEKYGILKKKKHDDVSRGAVGVRNTEAAEQERVKSQTDTNVKDAITREHDFDGEPATQSAPLKIIRRHPTPRRFLEPETQSAPLKTIMYDPIPRRLPWIRL